MLINICSRFVVLMCLLSLFACTTTSVIYPKSSSKDSSRSWLEHVKVGDKLKLILKGSPETIEVTVAEITPDTIKGDNGVSLPIADIVSAKTKHFSWIKTTFLTVGIVLGVFLVILINALPDIYAE